MTADQMQLALLVVAAIPAVGNLAPIAEYVEGLDGSVACNRDGRFVVAREFVLSAHEAARAAEREAAIAKQAEAVKP